ncbi:hypothetical protein [Trueperella pecoris]|nr:hypothetical protein [Trueperella pecoris]
MDITLVDRTVVITHPMHTAAAAMTVSHYTCDLCLDLPAPTS